MWGHWQAHFQSIASYVCACVLLGDIWSPGSPHATLACRWSVHTWGPGRLNISYEHSAPLDAIIESTWPAGKLLCEHLAEICGLPAPSPACCSLTCWASQLKANHSYRCWQLSLTHEMPLQSSSLPVAESSCMYLHQWKKRLICRRKGRNKSRKKKLDKKKEQKAARVAQSISFWEVPGQVC